MTILYIKYSIINSNKYNTFNTNLNQTNNIINYADIVYEIYSLFIVIDQKIYIYIC